MNDREHDAGDERPENLGQSEYHADSGEKENQPDQADARIVLPQQMFGNLRLFLDEARSDEKQHAEDEEAGEHFPDIRHMNRFVLVDERGQWSR